MLEMKNTIADVGQGDTYDAVVIGAGSAGLAFARKASAFGQRVAVAEKGKVGGTCVNRGCVPKKLLWHLAHWQSHSARLAQSQLISSAPEVNAAKALGRISQRTQALNAYISDDLHGSGIEIIEGVCSLDQDGNILIGAKRIRSRYVVVATGSSPIPLDIPGGDLLQTSDAVFEWTHIPGTICLIGGGYIGTEFAFILSALGAKVTVIEHSDTLLEGFDPRAASMITQRLQHLGVKIRTKDGIARADQRSAQSVCVKTQSGWSADFDVAINVTGREANTSLLEQPGIELEDMPSDCVALFRRTNLSHLFIIGDAAGAQQLTPVARFQGNALASFLFGAPSDVPKPQTVLSTAVFADPPLAEVRRLSTSDEDAATGEQDDQFDDLIEGILADVSPRPFLVQHGMTQEGRERLTMIANSAPEAMQLFTSMFENRSSLSSLQHKSRIHPTSCEEWFEMADTY